MTPDAISANPAMGSRRIFDASQRAHGDEREKRLISVIEGGDPGERGRDHVDARQPPFVEAANHVQGAQPEQLVDRRCLEPSWADTNIVAGVTPTSGRALRNRGHARA
jgi:hypothetical protein